MKPEGNGSNHYRNDRNGSASIGNAVLMDFFGHR